MGDPGDVAQMLRLDRMLGDDLDFDDESVMCPYSGEEAYCLGSHRYSSECIGKRGIGGEECKYFKLKK